MPQKITTANLDLILSDAPSRVRSAIVDLIVGRSHRSVAGSYRISFQTVKHLAEMISRKGPQAFCRQAGINLTHEQRHKRADAIAQMAKAGAYTPDIADHFGLTEVRVRQVLREKGITRKSGRPKTR